MTAADSSGRTLSIVGAILWTLGILMGTFFLFWMLVISPLGARDPLAIYVAEIIGFFIALVPCMIYIWIPVFIDRFEPEPWWALAMTLIWGALAAAGFSGLLNTFIGFFGGVGGLAVTGSKSGAALGQYFFGAVLGAPIVEEAFKGFAVLGMFWFMRREFDGIVDGVIYGTFAGLGFALSENVLYFSRAIVQAMATGEMDAFWFQFGLRGIVKPWGHPLYTSMTGIGIGIARETSKTWLKWVAIPAGYSVAVALHMGWNGSSLVGMILGLPKFGTILIFLVLYLFVLFTFCCILFFLVRREGKQLRSCLEDEVLMGNITKAELDLICSPFGRLKARFGRGGATAKKFVLAGIKLGMAKWHAARAMKGQKQTVSIQAIVPLRQEVLALKQQLGGSAV